MKDVTDKKNSGSIGKNDKKDTVPSIATNGKLYDKDFDERAIQAIHDRIKMPDAVVHLSHLITDQEKSSYYPQHELNKNALHLKTNFEQNGKVLGTQISAASEAINRQWGYAHTIDPQVLRPLPSRRDRLHVFGADRASTGGPNFYGLTWELIEGGFSGAGIGVSHSLRDGTFSASHYATGSAQWSSYSGIGVRFKPNLDWCKLSVRPLVNWRGFDILNHKEYDPQLHAKGWGVAGAQIGVHIQSWDRTGGAFFNDNGHWVPIWNRSEINPSGMRYYNDTADSRSLQLEILASGERNYAIWVSCRAFVISESKFGLDTRASASVSCELPFLVVEEMDI